MKGPASGQVQSLDGHGVGVGVGTPGLYPVAYLPSQVTEVPREAVRAFSHNKRVGTYLLGRSLGEGSFAKVKEALHLPTGEKVAVKVIDKKRAKADPYVRKNLRREGRLLQQIRHKHVIQLLEVLETEHSYYLVTEYCAGGDLMDYIAKRKKLEEREVKRFIRQIVSAIDYLHRLGIIHRDLKIENLLLDHNKDIKIIDFGLSNTVKITTAPEGSAHAQEYLVTQCGSPAYAAPELLNHRKYGLQVDVWSIGVNMYAMLTGTLPFTVDPFNIKTLYNKMISGQMNPIPDSLSREGKDILLKFLTADPEKRLTISEALRHPWLCEGRNSGVERPPFPNKLKPSDLNTEILKHMSENLGFRMSEVIRFVIGNVPSSSCATYHLYLRKLQRHLQPRVGERLKGGGMRMETSGKRASDPAKISLVLQDVTPRTTNTMPPPRALHTGRDYVVKEVTTSRDFQAVNGRKMSLETSRTPSNVTQRESGPAEQLSSLEHSLEDLADSKEKSTKEKATHDQRSHQSPFQQKMATAQNPRTLHTVQKHAAATKGNDTDSSPRKSLASRTVQHQRTAGGGDASTAAEAENLKPPRASVTMRTSPGASVGSAMPGLSRLHGGRPAAGDEHGQPQHPATSEHRGATSDRSGAGPASARKGRVLVPLNRTIAAAPSRKPVAGLAQAGAKTEAALDSKEREGGEGVEACLRRPNPYNSLHPERSTSPGPRVEGTRINTIGRAAGPYPVSSVPAGGTSPAQLTVTPPSYGRFSPTAGHKQQHHHYPGRTGALADGGEGRGTPVWRSVPAAARATVVMRKGSVSSDSGPNSQLAPKPENSGQVSPLSKRPVSPCAPPLVRRRLVKRSRQEGLSLPHHHHHNPQASEPLIQADDDGGGHVPDGDDTTDSVTVERLVASPEARNLSRATALSEASSVARDLHSLPAISTVVSSSSSPRH